MGLASRFDMQVPNATAGGSSTSLFTVVASGIQAGAGSSVTRTYRVTMDSLNTLYKRLTASGARILSVESAGDDLPAQPAPPASAQASNVAAAPAPAPTPKKKPHGKIPVNTYKPRNPFMG